MATLQTRNINCPYYTVFLFSCKQPLRDKKEAAQCCPFPSANTTQAIIAAKAPDADIYGFFFQHGSLPEAQGLVIGIP